MMDVITIAQQTPSTSVVATILAALLAAGGGLWTWFRAELNDCKKDRTELFARVENLHTEVSTLSRKVGVLEGQSGQGDS